MPILKQHDYRPNTQNTKESKQTTKPLTLNPETRTPDPKSQIPNPKFQTLNHQTGLLELLQAHHTLPEEYDGP